MSAPGANPGSGLLMVTKNTGAAGAGLKDGQCARQDLNPRRIVPIIWLVLDGSGSMVEQLGDKTRWAALRGALMDPTNGVVKSLEHNVQFGMIIYDGKVPGGGAGTLLPDGGVAMFSMPPTDVCPRLVAVEPALDNFMTLDTMMASQPLGGSTPTDKALEAVVAHLPAGSAGQMLDTSVNPTIVVLATDGAPNDFCSTDFLPPDVRPRVLSAVQQLTGADIKTYVISLAGEDQMLTQHLTDVAAMGNTGKPPFIPMNSADLIKTFQDIVGPGTSCSVKLAGKVKPGTECMGAIEVNGVPLKCNDPNGWMLSDPSTVTITGTACVEYQAKTSATLHADFPCESIALN